MNKQQTIHLLRELSWIAMFISLLTGCAAERLHNQGMDNIVHGHYEEGLDLLSQAANMAPRDHRIQADWLIQRQRLIEILLESAKTPISQGRWDDADIFYNRILKIEPKNDRASQGLIIAEEGRRQDVELQEARLLFDKGDLDESEGELRHILMVQPKHKNARILIRQIEDKRANKSLTRQSLNSLYSNSITLEFREANLKMALESISRITGINFVMDSNVRPDAQTTIIVKDATLEDAIDMILKSNQLLKKILDEKTVLIYPNNPDKIRDYQELVIRSFYLANANAQHTMELIKTFVKTKDIYVDDRLNLLIMRDTPIAISVAEKLISIQDLPDPEVMLEIQVLEIQSSLLQDLGIKYPGQINLTILGPSGSNGTGLTVEDLKHINSSDIGVSPISASINLSRELSDGNILANPRIRTRNREKAIIKIGDRVPVISTTQDTASNSISDNVQYLDVGLNVEVEPNIYLDDELAIKLSLEVSSVIKEVRGGGGSLAYQIGTRNVTTVLRLSDGETQVLGGLIRNDERQIDTKFPGLGDLPIIGRLFSSNHDEKQKTEIVLSITPHLIRNLERPPSNLLQFWSGTEAALSDGVTVLRKNTMPTSSLPAPLSGTDSLVPDIQPGHE